MSCLSSSGVISLRTKLSSTLTFFFIFRMLGCDSYLLIISCILIIGEMFSLSSVKFSMSRFSTLSIKKLFNFSATFCLSEIILSLSTRIISLCKSFCFSENKGLILFQNFLLSLNILILFLFFFH